MLGPEAQQLFFGLISLLIVIIGAYGARRYQSWGMAALAFEQLLALVVWLMKMLILNQYQSGNLGSAYPTLPLEIFSILSVAGRTTLGVAVAVLLLRDFGRWKKRTDESDAHADRLARDRSGIVFTAGVSSANPTWRPSDADRAVSDHVLR